MHNADMMPCASSQHRTGCGGKTSFDNEVFPADDDLPGPKLGDFARRRRAAAVDAAGAAAGAAEDKSASAGARDQAAATDVMYQISTTLKFSV